LTFSPPRLPLLSLWEIPHHKQRPRGIPPWKNHSGKFNTHRLRRGKILSHLVGKASLLATGTKEKLPLVALVAFAGTYRRISPQGFGRGSRKGFLSSFISPFRNATQSLRRCLLSISMFPAMNSQPSFARCKLHMSCIVRNPSRSSFYVRGIVREFKQATPFALLVGGSVLFVFGVSLVNLFF
jgi:hypothetical protein